jgi:hypothetical protein
MAQHTYPSLNELESTIHGPPIALSTSFNSFDQTNK